MRNAICLKTNQVNPMLFMQGCINFYRGHLGTGEFAALSMFSTIADSARSFSPLTYMRLQGRIFKEFLGGG